MALYDVLKRSRGLQPAEDVYYRKRRGFRGCQSRPTAKVHDERRSAYCQSHLRSVPARLEDGVQLKGYFAWSLIDNFEWGEGYSKRFGLYYVDYATQQRTLKDSGSVHADIVREIKRTLPTPRTAVG